MSDHKCTRCGLKVDRASPRLRELFSMKATGAPYARCKACRNLEKREREQAQRAADPEGFDAKRREQYREAYYRRRDSPRWKAQTRAAKRAAYQRKKAQQPDDPVERVIELSGLPYAYRIPYTDEFYLATDRKGAAQVWRCRGREMDDLGITLCYHERDGRREYFVYLLSMDFGDEYPSAMEILGGAWTLEGAKAFFDDDAPWEKVEGLPVWHYTDENGHHYVIQEVPVS